MTQNPFIQSQLEAFGECAAANLNDGEHPIPENGRMVQLAHAVEVTRDFLASSLRAAMAEGRKEQARKDIKAAKETKFWSNYEYDPEYKNGYNQATKDIEARLTREFTLEKPDEGAV